MRIISQLHHFEAKKAENVGANQEGVLHVKAGPGSIGKAGMEGC